MDINRQGFDGGIVKTILPGRHVRVSSIIDGRINRSFGTAIEPFLIGQVWGALQAITGRICAMTRGTLLLVQVGDLAGLSGPARRSSAERTGVLHHNHASSFCC